MLYRAENICFCGGLQFQDLNAQKFRPAGDYWPLKVSMLKVKQMDREVGKGIVEQTKTHKEL